MGTGEAVFESVLAEPFLINCAKELRLKGINWYIEFDCRSRMSFIITGANQNKGQEHCAVEQLIKGGIGGRIEAVFFIGVGFFSKMNFFSEENIINSLVDEAGGQRSAV